MPQGDTKTTYKANHKAELLRERCTGVSTKTELVMANTSPPKQMGVQKDAFSWPVKSIPNKGS